MKGLSPIEAPGVENFTVLERSADRQLAAHIVGYTGDGGSGVTGIEKSWDSYLSSETAKQQIVYTLDGLGHSIAGIEPGRFAKRHVSGAGVVLTIDETIQKIVENAGSAGLDKGAIVVMDPDTGEIKASASFPSYTQSTWQSASRMKRYPYDQPGIFKLQCRLHIQSSDGGCSAGSRIVHNRDL